MRRVLFHWRGIKIYSYPAMLYVGLVMGVLGGTYAAGLHGLDPLRVFAAQLLLVLPALVGARLLFVASRWDLFRRDPRRIWSRDDGGAAMFGGLVLAFPLSLPLLAALDLPVGAFWDAATITMLIGMIFTRVGCLLNGCCAGRPTQGPFGLYLPNVEGAWCRRLPTQLLEAGVAALLLLGTVAAWNRPPFAGAIFLTNLTVYGIVRCVLESTRESIDKVGSLALNRVVSVGLIAVATAGLLYLGLGGAETRGGVAGSALPMDFAGEGVDSGWYFLLAPLSVLAVLFLFRFVGCGSFGSSDSMDDMGKPPPGSGPGPPTFADEVKNDVPIAYWRLGEHLPPSGSMSGVTAANEMGAVYQGTYIVPAGPIPPAPALHSPGAPGSVDPQPPGLLPMESSLGGMFFNGGYVRVPGANAFNTSPFTVEALVLAQWNLTMLGDIRCLIKSFDKALPGAGRKVGFGIYAYPADVLHLSQSEYHWRVFVGTGANAVLLEVKDFTSQPNAAGIYGLKYTGPNAQRNGDPGPKVEAQATLLVFTFTPGPPPTYVLYYYFADRNIDWMRYEFVAPAGPFAPNHTLADLLIGMDDELGSAANPLLFPFHGKIQEVAIYDKVVDPVHLMNHGMTAFHS